MQETRATGRARGRAAPAMTTAALAVAMLMIAMLAGTAFAQSPSPTESAAASETPVASETAGASPTLPDTSTIEPGANEPTSNSALMISLLAVAAAVILVIGVFLARSNRTAYGRHDDLDS